jgi:hypothetical protein
MPVPEAPDAPKEIKGLILGFSLLQWIYTLFSCQIMHLADSAFSSLFSVVFARLIIIKMARMVLPGVPHPLTEGEGGEIPPFSLSP